MKKQVTSFEFIETICNDYDIDYNYKYKVKFDDFPIKNGKRKIKMPYDSIIVDKNGNEFPYMKFGSIRNEEKLIEFDYIYTITTKSLQQIQDEIGIKLESEPCRICEGGGWYSKGFRFNYKDIYIEK